MAWRREIGLTFLVIGIVLSGFSESLSQDSNRPPGEQLALDFRDQVVRVIPRTKDGTDGAEGYGFLVAERSGQLLIVTADHVVRDEENTYTDNPKLIFFQDLSTSYSSHRMELRLAPNEGDLAVLEAPVPNSLMRRPFAMSQQSALEVGTRAWRVGKAEKWVPNNVPGQYVGRAGAIWLNFDNLDTPRGSSGGPVLTDKGVVGMVVAEGGASGFPSKVLPIETIALQFRDWRLPWDNGTHIQPPTVPEGPPADVGSTPVQPGQGQLIRPGGVPLVRPGGTQLIR